MTITESALPPLTSTMNIYVVYGQSNSTGTAAGRLFSVSDPTFGAVDTFGLDGRGSRDGVTIPTSWVDLTYPPSVLTFTALPDTEIQEPFRARVRECFFYKALEVVNRAQIAATGERHRAVVATFGHTGYPISQLISGQNAYTNLVAGVTEICVDVVAAGLTPKIRGVIYVQGEQEFAASGVSYAATLGTLQANLETSLRAVTVQSEAIPMFITQQSNFSTSGTGFPASIAYPLLDQFSAHTAYPDKVILASPMYQGETISNSNLHYYGHQAWRWAAGVGNAVAAKIVNGTTWNPIRPKTITVASNIVDIEFHVPSGALVLDTTNATNTADGFFGFDFQQTGGTTTLTSVALLNSTTVRFTLSGAPDGAYPRIRAGRNSAGGAVVSGSRTGARTCLRDSANSDARQCNWCTHFDTPIYPNILDNISTASTAAYSLRKLRSAYSGSAIRVRRSSDNAEADIGFTADGDLNQVALLAHCGANNGFVTTWYDQSTNGYNQVNATAATQPKIVINGAVNLFNGKPAIGFTATGTEFLFNSSMTGFAANNNFFIGAVFEFLQASRNWDMVAGWRSTANTLTVSAPSLQGMMTSLQIGMHNTDVVATLIKVDVTTRLAKRIATLGRTGGTNGNGGTVTVTATGNSQPSYLTTGTQTWASPATVGFQIGGRQQVATDYGDKNIAEVVCFSQNLDTTNRRTLELNQGGYYAILVPSS